MSNTTNNYSPINSGVDGTALAHTLNGEPTSATARSNSIGENVQQAALHSTAPYVSPEERIARSNPRGKKCKANDDTCKGSRMKDLEFCVGHARSMGLLDKTWDKFGNVREIESSDA